MMKCSDDYIYSALVDCSGVHCCLRMLANADAMRDTCGRGIAYSNPMGE